MSDTQVQNANFISVNLDSRLTRCFITGEYCSQQLNIRNEKNKMHQLGQMEEKDAFDKDGKKNSIAAFVIMSFTDMSDVVYEWRIKPFVESLNYLFLLEKDENEATKLLCFEKEPNKIKDNQHKVAQINVLRADTEPASNYVICSRVCQQIQMADLIVVDVSSKNPNVFYELGLAMALGKMILPICYSESYYGKKYPQDWQDDMDMLKEDKTNAGTTKADVENHIPLYPWRQQLFEYYGIVYKRKGTQREYLPYKRMKQLKSLPSVEYDRFPYDKEMKDLLNGKDLENLHTKDGYRYANEGNEKNEECKIGQLIYTALAKQYSYSQSTLVVYTLDQFLNEMETGGCIIRFYRNMVNCEEKKQMFNGDRVAVLAQKDRIVTKDKDAKKETYVEYSIGEMLRIGVNQATYNAEEKLIRPPGFFVSLYEEIKEAQGTSQPLPDMPLLTQIADVERFLSGYERNRGMLLYPDSPVFVSRLSAGLPEGMLNAIETIAGLAEPVAKNENERRNPKQAVAFFCLGTAMMYSLRYCNQVVIDTSQNNLQSLFWLGMAHGSGVYAIRVTHELTKSEKEAHLAAEEKLKDSRSIFDVVGLWTAVYHSDDTEGFYRELQMVEEGVERHSKLLITSENIFRKQLRALLDTESDATAKDGLKDIRQKLNQEKETALESYYRRRFWSPMLRYDQLHIHVEPKSNEDEENVYTRVAKADFNTVASLTHYLSKHTVIGEYLLDTKPPRTDANSMAPNWLERVTTNCLCIGDETNKSTKLLLDSIGQYLQDWKGEDSQPAKRFSGDDINVLHRRVNIGAYSCENVARDKRHLAASNRLRIMFSTLCS